jgi:hypothetical protein
MASEDDVRRIALTLPITAERLSYGTSSCLALWCASEIEENAPIEEDPAKFFTTPRYDGYGIVLLRLDTVDTDELTELLCGLADGDTPECALCGQQSDPKGQAARRE